MHKIGDFYIITGEKWWFIKDKDGNVVKKLDLEKHSIDEVRMWREGYVKGLNASAK
jgi:hypothetical protein